MELLPTPPTIAGSPSRFSGDAWYDPIVQGEAPSRLQAGLVHFAPCARTAWHSHPFGQTIRVTTGTGIIATHTNVIIMRPGDTVHTPPGELHWHGAVPDQFMSHLAMYEQENIAWHDLVTDEEYAAAATRYDGSVGTAR
ncbi:cupin domain-containing protein [Microbacterium halophytorum]|uniref:cupin domain-containing protein n=1 Tax=Microbacterium halophytorum TaxID=2067568 RepID=UPI000CFD460A|nr:cupin domain-containing protein [Microbacterium halophytorum]